MTQHLRILAYLDHHRNEGITSWEAMAQLGVLNLPGRISELRQSGIGFIQEAIKVNNRFGDEVRVNRYFLL